MPVQEVQLDDGITIYVEIPQSAAKHGMQLASRNRGQKEGMAAPIRTTLEVVKSTVNSFLSRLRQVDATPDEIEMTFGVTFSTEAGVVFARAGTDAAFEVKVTWKDLKGKGPEPEASA